MTAGLLRALGVLMIVSAAGFALSRAPDRSVESLVARWAPAPSDFIEVRGMVAHVRDEGPRSGAAPLVLLHGAGSSLHTWEGWTRALAPSRRVVTLDLPGFGLTGPRMGAYTPQDDYRADTDAQFVLDLLEAMKISRFVVGGNSLGGEVAWRIAVMAPERVQALILVDAAGPAFTPEAVPPGLLMARVPLINRLTEHLLPRQLVAASVMSVYGNPQRVSADLVDRYFELTLREGNRRALAQRLQRWSPGRDEERIAQVRAPTLILWGSRDRLIPPTVARSFEQRIVGSQLVMLEGLGHVPQEEDPARSVAPVLEFLRRLFAA